MQLKKHLVAGPWSGEFGWELFAWHGYVRALSRHFEKTSVVSRPNSEYLYSDFADKFIPFAPEGGMADSFFMHNFDYNSAVKSVVRENNIEMNKDTTLLVPKRIGFPPNTHYTEAIKLGQFLITPEYRLYGAEAELKYDFIFHIRDRKLRSEDNWIIDNWRKLRDLLGKDKKIACVGTSEQSGIIEDTDDLRDISLEKTCNLLHNAKYAFGPSSGPMHLASLCGCPHIVWSIKDRTRYTTNWNPLETSVLYLDDEGWHISPERVHKEYINWSKNENT